MPSVLCATNSNKKIVTMKTVKLFAFALVASALFLTGCKEEETPTPPSNPSSEVKSGLITADETWTNDRVYIMSNKVVVDAGVTLTIEAGTLIKAKAGQGTLAAALVVARGGKLIAEGTASQPIIFTSEDDNIQRGELTGTNLTKDDNKLWGGIIILGDAPISAENGDTETNIEGIPVEDGYGLYGGNNPGHNGGTLRYVSIRHGGITIGEGNEINGLTTGGCGTGTIIENVEVYATLDDGIECFGGTNNISKALVFNQGDDGIDVDMNYSGTISEFAVYHGDGIGTDEALEIDGPEGSTYTTGRFTLENGICKSMGSEPSAGDFKSRAQGTIKNVSFVDYGTGKPVKIRTRFDDPNTCNHRTDAYSHLSDNPATLVFESSNIIEAVRVYDGDDPTPAVCTTELNAAQTNAEGLVVATGSGSTIDVNALFGWTCAGQRGEL
jgi:hypothetical protein